MVAGVDTNTPLLWAKSNSCRLGRRSSVYPGTGVVPWWSLVASRVPAVVIRCPPNSMKKKGSSLRLMQTKRDDHYSGRGLAACEVWDWGFFETRRPAVTPLASTLQAVMTCEDRERVIV